MVVVQSQGQQVSSSCRRAGGRAVVGQLILTDDPAGGTFLARPGLCSRSG